MINKVVSWTNETKKASNQTAAIPKGVQVLQNIQWACKVLPALCVPGLNSRIFRRYCLSVVDDCLYCCCTAAHCSLGLFGGRIRRKETQEKKQQKLWRCRPTDSGGGGGGSSVAQVVPDPLLTVECFSSLRNPKFSMESGLPHKCVLRPQRWRKWVK